MTDYGKSDKNGFRTDTKCISCIPCRCKRHFYHKETKTTAENSITTTNSTNAIENRRNIRFGSTGRHTSPDVSFRPENVLRSGSVEICDTGWAPEELEERVDRLESSVEEIKNDVEDVMLHKVIRGLVKEIM